MNSTIWALILSLALTWLMLVAEISTAPALENTPEVDEAQVRSAYLTVPVQQSPTSSVVVIRNRVPASSLIQSTNQFVQESAQMMPGPGQIYQQGQQSSGGMMIQRQQQQQGQMGNAGFQQQFQQQQQQQEEMEEQQKQKRTYTYEREYEHSSDSSDSSDSSSRSSSMSQQQQMNGGRIINDILHMQLLCRSDLDCIGNHLLTKCLEFVCVV